MQAVSFGPHRGADWLNRVAWQADDARPLYERFTLIAQDPKHPRTLWVTLSITQGPTGAVASSAVVYDDRATGKRWLAEEQWPMDRVRIDPTRAGMGVGECTVGDGNSHGLIRGTGFAISWSLMAPQPQAPQSLLGSPWLYQGRALSNKVALTSPTAAVLSGHLEIWHTLGRYADKMRLDCTGWQVSQNHTFGSQKPAPWVHVHVPPTAVGDAMHTLDLFIVRTALAGILPTTLLVGAWQTPKGPEMTRAWRYGGVLPTTERPGSPWQFTSSHGGTTWRGEVIACADHVVATTYAPHGAAHHVAFGATVRASVTLADGHTHAIASEQATVEVGCAPG